MATQVQSGKLESAASRFAPLNLFSRVEAKLRPAALGVSFGFSPALLRWRFKRPQASHFIEDAFRVQLAFQPLKRAIHWFAFSNNDFWHQFTSIPKNSPDSDRTHTIYSGRLCSVKSAVNDGFLRSDEGF